VNSSPTPTILFVPGLRDHVPEHWQTLLEAKLPNARSVPRMERDKLSCTAWVAALDRTLATIDGPALLVAGRRRADLSHPVLTLVEDGDAAPLRSWLAEVGVRPEKPVRLV